MAVLRLLTISLALSLLGAHAQQPSLTADQIMARVAANQDRSEAARAHYVYVQHASVTSRRGSTVHCEEVTDTRVTPTPTGSNQQLLKLDGRLLHKGNYIHYDHLPTAKASDGSAKPGDRPDTSDPEIRINIPDENDTTDLDLVENMRDNLLGDKAGHSKDGINANLFPLTSKQQAAYVFTLRGREPRNGRDTLHIEFHPKDKNEFSWKGDAWIDTSTFQPVVIRTALSRNIPLGVRVLLGTNVPGIGFTAIYAPQPADKPDAVWFPVSFGSEFKIHVLFVFSREIVISAENRDFEKTHVTSTILPDTAVVAPPQP